MPLALGLRILAYGRRHERRRALRDGMNAK